MSNDFVFYAVIISVVLFFLYRFLFGKWITATILILFTIAAPFVGFQLGLLYSDMHPPTWHDLPLMSESIPHMPLYQKGVDYNPSIL